MSGWLVPNMFRLWDRKFSSDIYTSRKTSMGQYRALYSGGEYIIHFKYAQVLNIICITFMYGVGLPILFPIAAFSLFNRFVCERILVAYFMKQPPVINHKLTRSISGFVKFAPMIMILNGYLMISNG